MRLLDFRALYASFKGEGCYEVQLSVHEFGYSRVTFDGQRMYAHRAAWVLHNGPITSTQFVCHKCDNPACIRVEHLFLGTAKDNTQDCIAKGRFYKQAQDVVDEDAFAEMFYAGVTLADIAAALNIGKTSAHRIAKRRGMER